MKCLTKGKLLQFTGGRMSANERRIISIHLDDCPECRSALQRLQVDSSFIREKMKMLDPATIPVRSFTLSKAEQVREARHSAFPMLWRASVRIPATALIAVGIVFVGLISGLVAQGRRLARQESQSAARAQAETIVVSAVSSFQVYGLDIDLKNYQPIDHPNIIFLQKEMR
jgi:anti-sigma factor RsiW